MEEEAEAEPEPTGAAAAEAGRVRVGGWLAVGVAKKRGLLTDQGCTGSSDAGFLSSRAISLHQTAMLGNTCKAALSANTLRVQWRLSALDSSLPNSYLCMTQQTVCYSC